MGIIHHEQNLNIITHVLGYLEIANVGKLPENHITVHSRSGFRSFSLVFPL